MPTTSRDSGLAVLMKVMDRLDLPQQLPAAATATVLIDGLRIVLTASENKLRLVFKIADLPKEAWARESKLLEAARFAAGNLANMDRDRETLTVSENVDEILLFRVVAVDQMEVDQCMEELAYFVDASEYWQRALGSSSAAFAHR